MTWLMPSCHIIFKKVKTLMEDLPATQEDPLKWLRGAFSRWERKGKLDIFQFREVTLDETIKMIGRLSNSTAFGIDSIDSLSIKLATLHLAQPIRHLINVSLLERKFANRWKLAKIFPLLKDKDLNKLSPESYRPVAILPTLSKLVERAAHSQLLSYLERTEQLNPNAARLPGWIQYDRRHC